MITRSLDALVAADDEEARRIIDADRIVNQLQVDSDDLCLRAQDVRHRGRLAATNGSNPKRS